MENSFDKNQIYQIEKGKGAWLLDSHVNMYAKAEFDYLQMHEIRLGFMNGLTGSLVGRYYYDSKLSSEEMKEIRLRLENVMNYLSIKKTNFLNIDEDIYQKMIERWYLKDEKTRKMLKEIEEF